MKAHTRSWAALLAAAMLLMSATGCNKQNDTDTESNNDDSNNSGFHIGYADEGITAVDSPEAVTEMVDSIYAGEDEIMLEYQNDAYSSDGINFNCYIANAVENLYDLFIAIYPNDDFSEELFLSKLIRPGTAFETLTLNRALPPGDNTVTVAFTQVEEENGEQVIHGQTAVTMQFHVTG